MDQEDSEGGKIHETRVKRTPEQSAMILAFQTDVPALFGGPQGGQEKNNPLTAIKTPELWDAQDGVNGVCVRATTSLVDQKDRLLGGMQMEMAGHPETLAVTEFLLDKCDTCWEKLGSGLDSFFCMLVKTMYGNHPTKDQLDKCWKEAKLMLRVFLCELWKVHVKDETAYNAQDADVRVGRYLWHTLQAHRVMDKFKVANFHRHKEVVPAIVGHLFEHHASKTEVSRLWVKLVEAEKKLATQGRQLSALQSTVHKLQAKVNKR